MATKEKKPNATVIWNRHNTSGHVYFRASDVSCASVSEILIAIVKQLESRWVTIDAGDFALTVRQPLPHVYGGAAEIEQLEKTVRRVRDRMKGILRERGYSVR